MRIRFYTELRVSLGQRRWPGQRDWLVEPGDSTVGIYLDRGIHTSV